MTLLAVTVGVLERIRFGMRKLSAIVKATVTEGCGGTTVILTNVLVKIGNTNILLNYVN